MTYVIAGPCIGVKDTACVGTRPVDCIHPKKNATYDDGPAAFDDVQQPYIDPIRVHPITLPRRQISAISRTSKSCVRGRAEE
jgi:hypothetical protein